MSSPRPFAIYSRLPVGLQNAACSVAGVWMWHQRYNRVFREAYGFLQTSEWWPREQLEAYQNSELRKVIAHAYDSVPFYRRTLDSLHLSPADFERATDLDRLPILTKQIIREHWAELQSTTLPERQRRLGHTGGTTGTALRIGLDRDTQPWQWAVWWRHRNRFGINLNDPFIVFAGRDVVPLDTMDPPFWRRNLPMHQTYVSVHHLTRDNLPALAEYLCRRKVSYYSGYPSALYLVASYLYESGIELPYPPKMTFTGAETLLPHQRAMIEKGFSTTVSDQYGASEHCANISECEHFRYHVDMEFGIVEFLPIPGLPDQYRRIICTGLHNYAMPLIRYDIGDVAILSEDKCACGRESPVVEKIDGRIEDYIMTPDGRQLGRLDFLFKHTDSIREAQLIQRDISSVTLRIVREQGFTQQDEQSLIRSARKYVGDAIAVNLEYVDAIPRESNGKFRQIVSTILKDHMHSQEEQNSV